MNYPNSKTNEVPGFKSNIIPFLIFLATFFIVIIGSWIKSDFTFCEVFRMQASFAETVGVVIAISVEVFVWGIYRMFLMNLERKNLYEQVNADKDRIDKRQRDRQRELDRREKELDKREQSFNQK